MRVRKTVLNKYYVFYMTYIKNILLYFFQKALGILRKRTGIPGSEEMIARYAHIAMETPTL